MIIMAITKVNLDNFATEVSQSEKPVLIDFSAEWCMPCKMLAPELEAFSASTETIKVCQIDVDESSDLASMYGIISVPTLILTRGGKEIERRVGGCEKKDIEAFCLSNI